MEAPVLSENRGSWRKLIFNRPDKLNSLNPDLLAAFTRAVDAAEADPACRALLLTGAGRGFCAGQELSPAIVPGPDNPNPALGGIAAAYHEHVVRRLRGLKMPVVCAVNGVAAGAGANIALACDIVVAARSAKFIQSFASIGLIPDSGGTWVLPRLVGLARALGVALTGEPIPAERAEAWGLIWKCVDDEQLEAEAARLAARFAAGPTGGLAATKRAIRGA